MGSGIAGRGSEEAARASARRFGLRAPSGRAALGAVLIVAAASGVLAAHRSASATPEQRWVVVTRDVPEGTVLGAGDLGTVAAVLPTDAPAIPAADARSLVGTVALAPLEELALLRPGDVGDPDAAGAPGTVEVPVQVERERSLDESIHAGSVVDVLSTDPSGVGTETLARGVTVLAVTDDDDGIGAGSSVRYRLSLPDPDTATAVVDASVRSQLTLVRPQGPSHG